MASDPIMPLFSEFAKEVGHSQARCLGALRNPKNARTGARHGVSLPDVGCGSRSSLGWRPVAPWHPNMHGERGLHSAGVQAKPRAAPSEPFETTTRGINL